MEKAVIPTHLCDSLRKYLLTVTQAKLDQKIAFEFLKSAEYRIIINGHDVTQTKKLDYTEFMMAAMACYINVYPDRYVNTQLTKKLVAEELSERDFNDSTLWTKFLWT